MSALLSRNNYDSDNFESPIEEIHRSLEEERVESDKSLDDIDTGDLVTYQVGNLTLELTYMDSGDSAAFIQSYDLELKEVLNGKLEESGELELDDKYVRVA
jgi:hypothetical protein